MKDYQLPKDHKPFADKYFLRTNEILKAEHLNPWVRAQVFIREGPGVVQGMDEALQILDKYGGLVKHGGRVFAKNDGDLYLPKETLMVIEAPIQDIVELETMYLGVISAETTKANDHHGVDLAKVKEQMAKVVEAAIGRPVSYFGARHWRFDEDAGIARAAFEGGATSCSTDAGAETFGQLGMGTIPHALENIMAWKYGYKNAVVEATKAFDRVIDQAVPRIALIDYANREIDDSLATARAIQGLYGVRVDTCGENLAQGAVNNQRHTEPKHWFGTGVNVTGVNALRRAFEANGFEDLKIILSSGFGNEKKVKAFIEAEKRFGRKLFDALGVGGVYKSRMATMDIVAVGEDPEHLFPMSKIGRTYHPNDSLELRLS